MTPTIKVEFRPSPVDSRWTVIDFYSAPDRRRDVQVVIHPTDDVTATEALAAATAVAMNFVEPGTPDFQPAVTAIRAAIAEGVILARRTT